MNIKFTCETVSDYSSKVTVAAKDLKVAGKDVPDEVIAFQILENLPDAYENLAVQLQRLTEFTVEEITKQL